MQQACLPPQDKTEPVTRSTVRSRTRNLSFSQRGVRHPVSLFPGPCGRKHQVAFDTIFETPSMSLPVVAAFSLHFRSGRDSCGLSLCRKRTGRRKDPACLFAYELFPSLSWSAVALIHKRLYDAEMHDDQPGPSIAASCRRSSAPLSASSQGSQFWRSSSVPFPRRAAVSPWLQPSAFARAFLLPLQR